MSKRYICEKKSLLKSEQVRSRYHLNGLGGRADRWIRISF